MKARKEKPLKLNYNTNLTILNKYSPNCKLFKPLNFKIIDKRESCA